jgi:hypothetical protein
MFFKYNFSVFNEINVGGRGGGPRDWLAATGGLVGLGFVRMVNGKYGEVWMKRTNSSFYELPFPALLQLP